MAKDTGSPGNWSIRVPRKYQEHAHLGPKGGQYDDVGRMLKIFLTVFRLADVLVGWANYHVHHSEVVGRKAGGSSKLHQRGLPSYLDPGILATEWSLFRAKQYGFQQKELEGLEVYIRKAPMGSNHFMEFCMIWAFPLDAWCYTWIQMFQMILFLWS